jgi:hypothetical protein
VQKSNCRGAFRAMALGTMAFVNRAPLAAIVCRSWRGRRRANDAEHPAEQGGDCDALFHLGPSDFQAWRMLCLSLARSSEDSGGV